MSGFAATSNNAMPKSADEITERRDFETEVFGIPEPEGWYVDLPDAGFVSIPTSYLHSVGAVSLRGRTRSADAMIVDEFTAGLALVEQRACRDQRSDQEGGAGAFKPSR